MIPDAATIARRRHTVTIIVRFGIALLVLWFAWNFIGWLSQTFQSVYEFGFANLPSTLVVFVIQFLPSLFLVSSLFFFHDNLVRWIVPIPRPDHLCPKCNYSLKDLRSPICPECGTNLRG
jgi:hypothetical protein